MCVCVCVCVCVCLCVCLEEHRTLNCLCKLLDGVHLKNLPQCDSVIAGGGQLCSRILVKIGSQTFSKACVIAVYFSTITKYDDV